ncbi:MAG: tetratricopeptide repeat protein [Myxococcales bacterium]|nr:tetratricopeptide repeat protein [Myxococcota bacterium]MDW8283939.1 tetratricopeptide repeat protein [Myxococcales bacterium]
MKRALLAGLLLATPVQASPEQLWGGQEEAPPRRYQQLCERARTVLDSPREASAEALRGTVALLREATRLHPDGVEGWALLGRALLETGDQEAARPLLETAWRRGSNDSRLLLGLALLRAQQGELEAALELYLRLRLRGLTSPLVLRRTGDVLMALGRLVEAMEVYRLACLPGRRSGSTEVARACFALAVAYDRDGRLQASAAAARRALLSDAGLRSLGEGDFIPPGDRAYYQALVAEAQGLPPCAQAAPLLSYLQAAESLERQGWPGRTYPDRARSRLERLPGACRPEYSASISTDEPPGSQQDRDGGVPWQTRADAEAR